MPSSMVAAVKCRKTRFASNGLHEKEKLVIMGAARS
jgi:hypothetical protein